MADKCFQMIEDNTPTVTSRRRKPTELLRLRLETARRLQGLNAKTKAKRAASKAKRDKEVKKLLSEAGSHAYEIAPRVPKIKKNKLSQPLPPDSKFKKRQREKTWLPTHMFHAKRAHMTPPKEPLWRFAIPLTPTEKSYRPTHRAAGARGAVVWDMSYISMIQLEGTPSALESVLKAVGVDGDDAWGNKGKKWRKGTRSFRTWVHENEGDKRPIAPVTLIWCGRSTSDDVEMMDAEEVPRDKKKQPRDKLFIRVHPSAFLQLWNELLTVSKRQSPPVMVEDLRFEIGSIDITGPGSTEALIAALRPFAAEGQKFPADSPESAWLSLLGVTNPSSLPVNALLAFSVSDPRLHFPLQSMKPPSDESSATDLAGLLSSWPVDRTQGPPSLFERPARLAATRCLSSQKAINRRRTLAGPGVHPSPQPSDPQIPVIILANKPRSSSKHNNSLGSWTVLLPWKCVVPVWYMVMYYPLSSGGMPRFGGLKEQRQLAFERGEPWFPGDYPGTQAGWDWGQREDEERRKEWKRKPKGRRIEFDSIDLGNGQKGEVGRGWACDWERLIRGRPASENVENGCTAGHDDKGKAAVDEARVPAKATQVTEKLNPPLGIEQLSSEAASSLIDHHFRAPSQTGMQPLIAKHSLTTVKISLYGRGTPTPCARVYRLPTGDYELRQKWLSLASPAPSVASSSKPLSNADLNAHPGKLQSPKEKQKHQKQQQSAKDPLVQKAEARQKLAASLLESSPSTEEDIHLPMPPEEDLIGFVTTGNYNLSEGRGTGIGSILISKVVCNLTGCGETRESDKEASLEQTKKNRGSKSKEKQMHEMKLCIVRSAGERVGRLGVWELV
jgi:ribonuclease P/MRP protein subunit POP1